MIKNRTPNMPASTEFTILKTLLYFDIFNYPLTKEEIFRFHEKQVSEEEFKFILQKLIASGKLWQFDEFYSLQNNINLVDRRRAGNKRATVFIDKAASIVKTLSQFPYVRAIGISGSVSKNFADENADIDYFIITHANRLWIARTFMHLYKKIPFLKNRNRFYCMNYYIDELQLQLEEKNIYTATELVTLMPMYGNGAVESFYDANTWAFAYFPNLQPPIKDHNTNQKDNLLKRLLEKIFNTRLGDWLDDYLFRLTTKRWKLKEDQQRLNIKGERMGLKTSKHYSKPNPNFFHNKFMSNYEKRLDEIKNVQAKHIEQATVSYAEQNSAISFSVK